jgi:hypothetical protein
MVVTSISQQQNVVTHLCWKNGYDISVTNASDNSTETTIPLQKDSKTDPTALEDMEAPNCYSIFTQRTQDVQMEEKTTNNQE